MESTNDDYKLIKKSFEKGMYTKYDTVTHKIFRVIERDSESAIEQIDENMLLYHGTSSLACTSILREGFRPSTIGWYGRGVYLTASPSTACSFSRQRTCSDATGKSPQSSAGEEKIVLLGVLVNEVLQSKKLKIAKYDSRISYQFAQYIRYGNIPNDYEGEIHEKDSNGNRIRTSREKKRDKNNHFVCDDKYVKPRYYIQFFQTY